MTRASAVPAAALAWGSSVEYRQQRKSKRPLRKEQFRPVTERPLLLCGRSMGIVRLLFFPAIHSLLSFNPLNGLHSPLLLIPRTILIFVPQGKIQKRGTDMDQNVNYYGIILLLRQLRESGSFSEKELRSVAARIAADSGADIMISL